MGKLTHFLKNAATFGYANRFDTEVGALKEELKSLRDQSLTGDSYQTGLGSVGVIRTSTGETSRLFKKQNIRTLRNYAEFSVWVRAAIDIYRDIVARAEWKLGPFDPKLPVNEGVEREIKKLLDEPNSARKPYSVLQEELTEDFLVLGHGVIELGLRNDATPYQLLPLDAGRLAFVQGWDGTDPRVPRYAVYDAGGMKVLRWLADPMALVLVNRSRSYDLLGLSHVEMLDLAVRALIETDDFFLREAQNPTKTGMLNLGQGVTQPQVDEVRRQLTTQRHPFGVMGGAEGASYIPFNGTEREMRMLDRQTWFVREVAAIFQVPISKLQVKAEGMTRASTEAQFDEMEEGPAALLWRLREAENQSIVLRFGTRDENNIVLDYPIMSRKDEKRQAEVSKLRLGGQSYSSVNEARRDGGLPPLDDMPVADDVLINVPQGPPIPLSVLNALYFDEQGKIRAEEENPDGGGSNTGTDGGAGKGLSFRRLLAPASTQSVV
jgi:hypothetical protein